MKAISNVFWIAVAILMMAVVYGVAAPKNFKNVTTNIENFITSSFGWYYLILVTLIVFFASS